ncbi:DUF3987 domain-containing protein [Pseudooceanicola aestuarii]|uniref:DUF3987 domain-containing protein n=1 Tax=Pseudooceanicola aestuarii TaxID=2697319 RepID=UPI0013D30E0E|nr:DUF3987 domain-containing protein [Pseudooceanicola aestuarii]
MLARIKSLVGRVDAKASKPNFSVPHGETAAPPREPTPLPHAEPPASAFPLDCLTPKLRSAAEAIVRKTQGPAALAAQSVLSVASLVAGSRAKVQTLGSPSNATAAFVTIALSGERKSAADKIAKTGIDRVIMRLRKEHEIAMALHKSEIASAGRGEEKPAVPVCPSFLVTEPTVEGAFKAIASGCGFLGWFTDEAASFWGGHSMSKDQRAKTSGIVSKFWDGDYFFRPRAGQEGDGYVPPTATTINLMFQPTLIRDTYGDEFLIGQGILARMLPCWPVSNMGNRKYRRPTAEDEAAAERFHDEVEAALMDTLADPTQRFLSLSEDALSICVEFHDNVEAELGRGGWATDISGFASKAPEHACRLAAIMTLFEDGAAETVSGEVMKAACEMVKYYLSQYKFLCIAATNETEIAQAQALLDWLRKNLQPGDGFATDRVLQFGPVAARRSKALDRQLAVLMQYGWIQDLPAGTKIDGKKRRKAFRLSPKA